MRVFPRVWRRQIWGGLQSDGVGLLGMFFAVKRGFACISGCFSAIGAHMSKHIDKRADSADSPAVSSTAKRTVFVKTYGCQMNVYDSQRMADALAGRDFTPVDSPDTADLVILNTCHIREKAAEKVFSEVGRLRQLKDSRAKDGKSMYIAVAGCVAQAEGAEIVRRAPAVDMVFGPQTYHRLPI